MWPSITTSTGCRRYFITFIDIFLRNVWLDTLKSKEEFFEKFKKFKAFVETQSEYNIKVFRSNNGGDLISKPFNGFLRIMTSKNNRPPHICLNKTRWQSVEIAPLWKMTRNMLHVQNLNKPVINAVYTRNSCPIRALHSITPGKNVKRKKTLHCTYACVRMHWLPNDAKWNLKWILKTQNIDFCKGPKAYMLMYLWNKFHFNKI